MNLVSGGRAGGDSPLGRSRMGEGGGALPASRRRTLMGDLPAHSTAEAVRPSLAGRRFDMTQAPTLKIRDNGPAPHTSGAPSLDSWECSCYRPSISPPASNDVSGIRGSHVPPLS